MSSGGGADSSSGAPSALLALAVLMASVHVGGSESTISSSVSEVVRPAPLVASTVSNAAPCGSASPLSSACVEVPTERHATSASGDAASVPTATWYSTTPLSGSLKPPQLAKTVCATSCGVGSIDASGVAPARGGVRSATKPSERQLATWPRASIARTVVAYRVLCTRLTALPTTSATEPCEEPARPTDTNAVGWSISNGATATWYSTMPDPASAKPSHDTRSSPSEAATKARSYEGPSRTTPHVGGEASSTKPSEVATARPPAAFHTKRVA